MSTKKILEGMIEKWGDIDAIKDMANTLDLEGIKTWINCCIERASENKKSFLLLVWKQYRLV